MLSKERLIAWERQLARAHPGDIVSMRREEGVEIFATIRQLQRRVAELEADAALGGAVREIPDDWQIHLSGLRFVSTKWVVSVRKDGKWIDYFGPTPEAALEAARKGGG